MSKITMKLRSQFKTMFFICSWLLLTTLPESFCSFDFSVCKERPYNCGNLSNIFYPFWGHNRPSQCGGGEIFELSCQNDHNTTSIGIGRQNFTVKEINRNTQTMRVVHTNLDLNSCSPQFEDTYVNPYPFRYSPSVYNITIFYDCPGNTDNPYVFEQNFTCGGVLSYFVVEDEDLSRQGCKKHLHVPAEAPLDYYDDGVGYSDLVEVIDRGFEFRYDVSQDCTRCLGSEGECWSHDFAYSSSCYYCPDGSHSLHCYHSRSEHNLSWKIILSGIATVIIGIFMICIIVFCSKYMGTRVKFWMGIKRNRDIESFLENNEALALKRYKYSDVKKMTNSFNIKLGQGGFGSVYKGELTGCAVAVKLLNSSKGNGKEFINEVASISGTSHVNIVTLIGFCLEGHKKALIYEFMSNGSLDKFIYNKELKTIPMLSWDNLWQIAIGIARGLEYLHRGCNTRILHFDIKPHNILLDENLCPKISDFGLSKLCARRESTVSMSNAKGTIGYIAPEVWNRHFGRISQKSDVYSYGMMLLEMVGGRRNINAEASQTSEIYFPHWAYSRLEQGSDLRSDGVIASEENEIARRMTMVGLWCVQTIPKDRPTMSKVIDMLEGNINSLEMPPKPVLSSPT